MWHTSEANTDLGERVKRLDNMLEKKRKNYWGWGELDWDALERSMKKA